ncbi:MAG TPA: hypothetical protein VK609_10790, partial [Mucilaginibacter sp.]|nr:hypothetical protein [Mucilaginibacter sp.]
MKKILFPILAFTIAAATGCKKDHPDQTTKIIYPDMAEVTDPPVLFTTATGVKVYNGGFGSAVAADPNDPAVFYMLTDRGSNVAGQAANSIIIGKPDFDPQIGKFRLKDGKLVLEQVIDLKNAS